MCTTIPLMYPHSVLVRRKGLQLLTFACINTSQLQANYKVIANGSLHDN